MLQDEEDIYVLEESDDSVDAVDAIIEIVEEVKSLKKKWKSTKKQRTHLEKKKCMKWKLWFSNTKTI